MEFIKVRKSRRYRECELEITNRLIELKGDMEGLEAVVKEREGLAMKYEEDKKSVRKLCIWL